MAEIKAAQQAYGAPSTSAFLNPDGSPYTVATPLWCTIVRGFQVFFAFVILILAGILIHGYAMDANAFALVCSLFTFIIVTYALVTEKNANANRAYNIWAVLSLDLFMVIFWLASMGANAALRATFTVNVNIESCYNDGSAVSSNHCTVSKRELAKRGAVLTPLGLSFLSAIAGLSALVMLLFIATLAYIAHTFRLHHQSKSVSKHEANVEMSAQQAPMLGAQQPTAAPFPQYVDQQQYQPQPYGQPPMQPQPIPTPQPYDASYGYGQAQQPEQQPSPYQVVPQQQKAPPVYPAYPDPSAPQYQHQMYSPHGTPVHPQIYQPPPPQ